MSDEKSPQEVIKAYRKRQERSQRTSKIIFWGFVTLILLVASFAIYWFAQGREIPLSMNLFATDTPTPTTTLTASLVPTETPTLTPTDTPTVTNTPTITLTPTPEGPFIYTVEEGDTLAALAEQFGVDLLVLIEANAERLGLDPTNPIIKVGDDLLVPPPGTKLSTPTPIPEDLPPASRIEYMVQPGDTLAAIALAYNSTVDDILKQNDIEDPNSIYVGQILIVRVNLVTPVPTETSTPEG